MKKKSVIIFLVFFLFIILNPSKINAEECSLSELNKLRANANAAEIKYYYIKNYVPKGSDEGIDTKNQFNISINNLLDTFYVISAGTNDIYTYDRFLDVPNTVTHGPFTGGMQYIFNFYTNTNDACNAVFLFSKTITLPSFNHYSTDPICKGIEDYKLCNMWYTSNITKAQFIEKVTEYKKSLENKDNDQNLSPQNKWDIIMDWLINNYNNILVTIILASVVIIVIIKINEKRKSVL